MRHLRTAILGLALLAGCQAADVRTYWDSHDIDYSDIRAAEDQFADFAEQAFAAPEEDALAALDVLFDKLKRDTVGYYIYSGWMDGSFYTLLSPCRNAALYGKAVDRIVADGILEPYECEPFLQKREWMQYNREGMKVFVPGVSRFDARTLVLVLDLGCPSCREALETVAADPQWDGLKKLAVGLGYGPKPEVSGWEYLFPENGTTVFDVHMTPIYFVVTADGTVESGYTPAI